MAQPQQHATETASSASGSAASSPHMNPDSPRSDGTDEPADVDRAEEDLSSPSHHRRRRSTARAGAGDCGPESREKRKRSRVTPEQLTQLESFFAANRSPTAARRKEISDMLGMTERQTQIWFQNRRAKAKLQAGNKARPSTAPSPDIPPLLSFADDPQLRTRIHEDGPIRLLSCTDLAIGTWRRIATLQAKYDLLAYVSEAKRCVAWYVHCAGSGFKMEVPFDIITDVTVDGISPGMAMVCLTLSRPPSFFLESGAPLGTDASTSKYWKPCSDWTEDMQASKVLRHELVGAAAQLSQDFVERYQLGRHAIPRFPTRPFPYGGEQARFDPVPAVRAPIPVAGQSGMYHPPRMDYLSAHHSMSDTLSRRASETSVSTHSPAPWDSSPVSSRQFLPMQHGAPSWAENYSVTTTSKPIVPYNVQPTDPARLPGPATSPPTSVGVLPPYMGGYFGELQGQPRRDSESSYISASSGLASSVSTAQSSFDLPSPQTADMSCPQQHWGEPILVEPQPLYDPQGYDQMQAHIRTIVGTDMPPYGFDRSGSTPDKHYR
ncbi:homeobox-domain-containing protein [Daedalea quercina L-15889]|uniref:Homeobox-domain-containing protein n=1 Tax=Daedalea quercina L-15889 TaxID=1314783 RepID=A0A165MM01_9APHY|nr:homeobox-domain-containing protein [Daedalea quercina L-15889]